MAEPGPQSRPLLDFVTWFLNPGVSFLLFLLLFSIFFGEVVMAGDHSPPAPVPPPPPQHPPVSCVSDLKGIGSLDTTCQLNSDLELGSDVYIEGKGNFYILPGIRVHCLGSGCSIAINISGNFSLGDNGVILAGTFSLVAHNASFHNGSVVNTTALAGSPPSQTSGTPQGIDGAGGGHGGRGACCLTDNKKLPEDVWGGDAYSWSTLQNPWSYGSRGGTTNKEIDYGGAGGGRISLEISRYLVIDGSILTDGGNGGTKGGGGSAGSILIRAYKMIGDGKISCSGGDGFAGGGGGRVSMYVYSRHDDPKIYVHGGRSFGCPENSGAAGSFYDAVPRSLFINNYNRSTDTDTLLLEFPYQPLWTNIYVRNHAKASVPLLWSRVQVQGQISLSCGGVLSFGLAHYALSEFELLAEELLMGDSVIKVYGALRVLVKMFLMWNSKMIIDGGGDSTVATSLLEGSNLIVLKESSAIHSNANLGVHGQGLLNLSGPGDFIEAQRLILSLFYSISVGPGSVLRAPLENPSRDYVTPRIYCDDTQGCPAELFHPPEDCNVNSSLPFTLQVCRVEDVMIEGLVKGSVVHFHRARSVSIQPYGVVCSSGMGCTGGKGRGKYLSNGISSGAGHGGSGGDGCYNGNCIEGGKSYGNADLPCELGSGSGDEKFSDYTAGGGIIVMGSLEHPLSSLYLDGILRADGGSAKVVNNFSVISGVNGGGSGGTVILFLGILSIGENAVLSSVGGNGSSYGGGGGGGGRIHFHWSDIPSGDVYQPIAHIKGSIHMGGGSGAGHSDSGQNGTLTGRACPKGLFGVFCRECPLGTYKNVSGSDRSLCNQCPGHELPRRAIYVSVRGGISETPCPYKCVSDRYHMPNCYTALEELIHTFGGPWLFGILLLGLLVLLALVLSVARIKFVGVDELPGPTPTQHGSQIDHSFPFLESLNEVLETNRAEESQSHVHRMYFLGPNTFREPWQLQHTPPEQVKEIVFEGAFNRFVEEINIIAGYQWWEGSIYTILSILTYPLAWSWQQWRRRMKLQRLREFVRSEYDHACLRSCRCRALYEGLKVAATADLMLAHVDFFLGGDEKRADLPPRLHQRFPLSLLFGGDGSYMSPFSVDNDNIITNLLSQSVPPTTWYRFVAGLNAHLRLVRRGRLRSTFKPVIKWLHTHANPALKSHGVRLHLACFQYIPCGYSQYGIIVYSVEGNGHSSSQSVDSFDSAESDLRQESRGNGGAQMEKPLLERSISSERRVRRRKGGGEVLDDNSLSTLEETRGVFYLVSFVVRNTKPVGHQDVVGLVISMLLLGDISLVLLTLLQLYSVSMGDVLLVLLILPLGILFPFPAGINALLSHGPRRSAGLARGYALWNVTSFINVAVAFICGLAHLKSKRFASLPKWNLSMDEGEWWVFSGGLVLCKMVQSQLINWHIANLEIPDRSLYTDDFELFWQS